MIDRSPGPDPSKLPNAERGPLRIGEPVSLQLVEIVGSHPLLEAWRHGDTSDAYFDMAVLEDLEDEWKRKGNDLPMTLYGFSSTPWAARTTPKSGSGRGCGEKLSGIFDLFWIADVFTGH